MVVVFEEQSIDTSQMLGEMQLTMPFKERKNYGEVPQYYVSNTHQGIVGRSDFSMVQKLMKQRGQSNANHTDHLFTHRIQCPDCGSYFRHSSSSGKSYWICPNRMNKTKDCTPYYFSERDIIFTSLNMFAKLYCNQDDYLSTACSLLREIEYSQINTDSKLYELDQTIAELNDKALVLQRLHNKGFLTPEEFRTQNDALASQRMKFTRQRKKKLEGSPVHEATEKLEGLQSILASWPGVPTEFDINIFDEIVEKIIPIDNGGSVTMGVAPFRPSCHSSKVYVLASLRFPVRSFIPAHCGLFPCKKLPKADSVLRVYRNTGIIRFPVGDALHQVRTGVQAV